MNQLDHPLLLSFGGLAIGLVMGYFARKHYFCSMTALERHWYMEDSSGLRSWALAAVVALLATLALQSAGLVDLSPSFYHALPVPLLGAIVGGLMFGFGMALVGTCSFGALIRFGGGSLNGLVVIVVIGLTSLAAQRGLSGHFRQSFIEPASLDLTRLGAAEPGTVFASGTLPALLAGLLVAAALSIWIFADRKFRSNRSQIIAGTVIGLCVAAGWLLTSYFHRTSFEPVQVEAASFIAPVGDLLLQFIAITGTWPGYGSGLVVGVILGAMIAAMRSNDLRWEACDNARELGRHILGAFLMGTGGIFALGCTVGQGISAVSALAVSAPLAIASIMLGARFGISLILEGSLTGFMRSGS